MTMRLTHRRADGSFLAVVSDAPYHVVEGDPAYWEQALRDAAELGSELPFEPEIVRGLPTVDDYRRAIQVRIDTAASERGYDSGASCSSYANSTNQGWAAEATAFIAWRDAVWIYAYGELAKVSGGQRAQPTIDQFIAELPTLTWPEAA